MNKKITPRDAIVYFIILFLMFYNLINSSCNAASVINDKKLTAVVIAAVLIYLIISSMIKYAWLSILLIIFIPKPLYILKYLNYLLKGARPFYESLVMNQAITNEYENYFLISLLFLSAVVIIVSYYITVIKRNLYFLIITGSIIYSVFYFTGISYSFSNFSIYLLLSLVLLAYNSYKIRCDMWANKDVIIKKNYYRRFIILIVIFAFIINFFTKILPYNIKPVNSSLLNSWFDKFNGIYTDENKHLSSSSLKTRFGLYSTGFQSDPYKLGGPVIDNHSIALKVHLNGVSDEIHLRGSIKDYYNGQFWEKTNSKQVKYNKEIKTGVEGLPYDNKSIEIQPVSLVTATAFSILYPVSIDSKWGYFFSDNDYELFNPYPVNKNQKYTVNCKDYIFTTSLLNNVIVPNKFDSSMNKYLQIPSGLPDRVINLTKEITVKYTTQLEKVSAVEKFLKTNYPYSKNTTVVPQGKDFIDYFLFEEKRGYCTYYATAMAVMLRIDNIPARYVEGFSIPKSSFKNNEAEVLNSNAHAWVEVYFDKIGWVPFDPTPGHTSHSILSFENNSNVIENNNQESKDNNEENAAHNKKQIDDSNDEGLNNTQDNRISIFELILISISSVFVLSVMIYIIKCSMEKSSRNFSMQSLRLIKRYGKYVFVKYDEGETAREYLNKVSKELGVNSDKYLELYEGLIYGGRKLTKDEQLYMHEFVYQLKNKVKAETGTFKFYKKDYLNMFSKTCVFVKNIKNIYVRKLFRRKSA